MPDNPPHADGARVLADLNALRNIGAYKTGVHKPTYSEPHMRSLEWLSQRLPQAGLTAEMDGIGNVLGRYFSAAARKDMQRHRMNLPDKDLAYFSEGSELFDDYVEAVQWGQDYAWLNRREMMRLILEVLRRELPPFEIDGEAINCHHNYVAQEEHFGEHVFVTRKGAISAREGQLGIIPGSMGAKSYIVSGLGNAQSFHSCAHGAGRRMSRTQAKRQFSRWDLEQQTVGVECRKDGGVIDEIPGADKDLDEVMANQADLVDVVHTLKQVLCVKG